MKSFLQQLEERFIELETDDELEEISTSAGAGAYMSKNFIGDADDDTIETGGMRKIKESVNTKPTYKFGYPQKPESDEEEYNSKFSFSETDTNWQHRNYEYPSIPYALSYQKYSDRKAHIPHTSKVKYDWSGVRTKINANEMIDTQYEKLIESYKKFITTDPTITPERKIKNTIKEVATQLKQIESLVSNTARLKTESGLSRDGYGTSVNNALSKIAERLIKISERVRALGE